MKKLQTLALLSLVTFTAFGQVKLRLPDTTAVPGSSISIPIIVEGFRNVGSLSLTVAFDSRVLTFKGVVNQPQFGFFNSTKPEAANKVGAIGLSWFNVTPSLNIPAGKLLDLLFSYKDGTSPLNFVKMVPSSVTDSLAKNLEATVRNGRISIQTTPSDTVSSPLPRGTKK